MKIINWLTHLFQQKSVCSHAILPFLISCLVIVITYEPLQASVNYLITTKKPWTSDLLEPDWQIGINHLVAKSEGFDISADDMYACLKGTLYPDVESFLSLHTSSNKKLSRMTNRRKSFPTAVQASCKKQITSDIFHPISLFPVALSVGVDLRFANKERIKRLVFQEKGRAQCQLVLNIGKHLALWSKDRYLQAFTSFSYGFSSDRLKWSSLLAGVSYSINRKHNLTVCVENNWSFLSQRNLHVNTFYSRLGIPKHSMYYEYIYSFSESARLVLTLQRSMYKKVFGQYFLRKGNGFTIAYVKKFSL